MKKIWNFGILGCGLVANIHTEALSRIEEANLIGVADNNLAAAESFAQKQGVKAYENYWNRQGASCQGCNKCYARRIPRHE